ncbi:MAG: galactokinase [bacterium]|nr:galactokinase [bacterium]
MIVIRTPFRVTLGGGGTDLPSYYEKYGGFVVSAALNKYMYITLNQPVVDDLVRVKYSKSETVSHRDELQHDIAREALRLVGIEKGIEIMSFADVPAGTGLGSSSSYAVGLLHGLHILKRQDVLRRDLAEMAITIEMDILKKPVGKQDQYMAAYGGLAVLDIDSHGRVQIRHIHLSQQDSEDFRKNLLMFYTHTTRDADTILHDQSSAVKNGDAAVTDNLHHIKEIGYKTLEALERRNFDIVGELFDEHWKCKKALSQKISNQSFDTIYSIAKENGALGGKISGAGGGGFFVFYVPKDHERFRTVMKEVGLREMWYHFDQEGTKSMLNF